MVRSYSEGYAPKPMHLERAEMVHVHACNVTPTEYDLYLIQNEHKGV